MRLRLFVLFSVITIVAVSLAADPHPVQPGQVTSSPDNSPVVAKVEPPNWWLRLTPELMVLLSGRHLEATGVACNLPNLVVERTQATAGGDYLFVWLKFGAELKTGTPVCRIITPTGSTSVQLPLPAPPQTIPKIQDTHPGRPIHL